MKEGEALGRSGRFAEAASCYERALADGSLCRDDHARALAHLSAMYRLLHRLDEAVRCAREGIELAKAAGEAAAEAHASMALGTALLESYDRSSDAGDGEELFVEALHSLERAAQIYERLGHVDFGTALLTLAEASHRIDELDAARALFARAIREMAADRWAHGEEVARHVDHVRGKACHGLALIALAQQRRDEALGYVEAAVNLLLASGGPGSISVLEDLAELCEGPLASSELAKQIREATHAVTT